MEISVEQFASRIRNNTLPGALLIGFDGSAALVNHHSAQLLYEDLAGTAPADGLIDWGRMASAWEGEDRRGFMEKHTRTTDVAGPDERAIDCIANLVKNNRIRAIISTDTARALYQELEKRGTDMTRWSCVEHNAKFLHALHEERVFADAILLDGLRPNILEDAGDTGAQAIKIGLFSFLEQFSFVYCWGWSQFNVRIGDLYQVSADHRLTAIGRETASEIRLGTVDIVLPNAGSRPGAGRGPSGRGHSFGLTSEIFHALGDYLYPGSRNSQQAAGPAASGAGGSPRAGLPHLLLNEEITQDVVDNASRVAVSFIGVEGDLVRHRYARWLAETWRAKGHKCYSYEGSNASTLAWYVTMTNGFPGDMPYVVGMLGDGAEDLPYLSRVLLPQARRWRDDARAAKRGNCHVALFVPVSVSEWTGLSEFKDDQLFFWAQSLYDHNFLDSMVLGKWVDQHVAPLAGGNLEADRLADLVTQMLRDAHAHAPRRADWLHTALDFWLREIQYEGSRRAGDAPGEAGAGLVIGDLFAAWSRICTRAEDSEQREPEGTSLAGLIGTLPEEAVDTEVRSAHPQREDLVKGDETSGTPGGAVSDRGMPLPMEPPSFDLGPITRMTKPGAFDLGPITRKRKP